MKKIITAILALCLCLGMAACKAEKEDKKDIVGEWMAVSINAAAAFNEDGTGELNYGGTIQSVSWKYDPDTDRYIVAADQTWTVLVSKEYDMDYMSLQGVDFYRPDDYDKAYTLMLSRRFEDITNVTAEMTKIKLDTAYDLTNGVTIAFTQISKDGDSLLLNYAVTNNRNETASEGLSAVLQGKYYLANHNSAVTSTTDFNFADSVGAGDMATGSLKFSIAEDPQATIDAYGMVIGALYFEMYGQEYCIYLSEWFQ